MDNLDNGGKFRPLGLISMLAMVIFRNFDFQPKHNRRACARNLSPPNNNLDCSFFFLSFCPFLKLPPTY